MLVIPGRMPGFNEILDARYRKHGTWNAYSEMKRAWANEIYVMALSQRFHPPPQGHWAFIWYESDKRRDPDNVTAGKKLIFDALVYSGLMKRDGWKQVWSFVDLWDVDKKTPRVVVLASKLPMERDHIWKMSTSSCVG